MGSPSEKLEALKATIPGDYSNWAAKSDAYETAPNGTHDVLAALRKALPEITAVVRAAEGCFRIDQPNWNEVERRMAASLTALDEKLAPLESGKAHAR